LPIGFDRLLGGIESLDRKNRRIRAGDGKMRIRIIALRPFGLIPEQTARGSLRQRRRRNAKAR